MGGLLELTQLIGQEKWRCLKERKTGFCEALCRNLWSTLYPLELRSSRLEESGPNFAIGDVVAGSSTSAGGPLHSPNTAKDILRIRRRKFVDQSRVS